MISSKDLCALIQKGGVYKDVEGETVSEILTSAVSLIKLPDGLDKNLLKSELIKREKILSTAVGNGIALPHPQRKLITNIKDQRVAVCFLRKPTDMNAPDARKVYVYFILLTADAEQHIGILSEIANLAKNKEFKILLESCPEETELLEGIRKCLE